MQSCDVAQDQENAQASPDSFPPWMWGSGNKTILDLGLLLNLIYIIRAYHVILCSCTVISGKPDSSI